MAFKINQFQSKFYFTLFLMLLMNVGRSERFYFPSNLGLDQFFIGQEFGDIARKGKVNYLDSAPSPYKYEMKLPSNTLFTGITIKRSGNFITSYNIAGIIAFKYCNYLNPETNRRKIQIILRECIKEYGTDFSTSFSKSEYSDKMDNAQIFWQVNGKYRVCLYFYPNNPDYAYYALNISLISESLPNNENPTSFWQENFNIDSLCII